MGSIPTPANSGGSGIFGKTAIGATHGNEGAGAVSSTTGNGARRVCALLSILLVKATNEMK